MDSSGSQAALFWTGVVGRQPYSGQGWMAGSPILGRGGWQAALFWAGMLGRGECQARLNYPFPLVVGGPAVTIWSDYTGVTQMLGKEGSEATQIVG